jgi:hypothetical protein
MIRRAGPLAVLVFFLGACSGGNTAGHALPAPAPAASQHATGILRLTAHRAVAKSATRKPAYVSPSTTYITLWIANVSFRVPCLPNGSCTVAWTAQSGPQTFAAEVDDGTTVLAEGSEDVTLAAGENDLPPITLNGVPATMVFDMTIAYPPNYDPCERYNTNGNCYVDYFYLADADGNAIEPPGDFEGGGMCITASDRTLTTDGQQCFSGPNLYGSFGPEYIDRSIVAVCGPGTTGTFFFTGASASSGTFGEVTAAQLSAFQLSEPNQSAFIVPGWPVYSCSNGTIAASS